MALEGRETPDAAMKALINIKALANTLVRLHRLFYYQALFQVAVACRQRRRYAIKALINVKAL